MGAIFTAGGLVVALAAVVTVLTVEDRIERRIKEMGPDLERRAEKQIQAYQLHQASQGADWVRAEELVLAALQRYPNAEHLRSDFGLRLADEVAADFVRDHGDSKHIYHPPRQLSDLGPPWEKLSGG